ncbi:MAG: hypothetical protein ABI707_16290, partial [Ferruginibacter sp.]
WATTPPLGWNSWDCFGTTVTEQHPEKKWYSRFFPFLILALSPLPKSLIIIDQIINHISL